MLFFLHFQKREKEINELRDLTANTQESLSERVDELYDLLQSLKSDIANIRYDGTCFMCCKELTLHFLVYRK